MDDKAGTLDLPKWKKFIKDHESHVKNIQQKHEDLPRPVKMECFNCIKRVPGIKQNSRVKTHVFRKTCVKDLSC